MKTKKKLEEVLVQEKFIKEKELKKALEESKASARPIEKILIANNLIDEERLVMAKASVAGIPFIKLSERQLDNNIVREVPEDIAKKHNLIPVEFKGNTMQVAMVMPSDLVAVNEVKLITGCEIQPLITTEKEMRQALNKYFKVEEISKQSLIDMRMETLRAPKKTEEEEEIATLDDIPSVKLVNDIIMGAVNRRASDIHFEPKDPEMVLRYRVDGVLYDIMIIPKHMENAVISRLKIMANLNITETRRPQDGHITLKRGSKTYDFRMSTLLTVNGEKVVLRVLDRESMLIGLEKLGLLPDDERLFKSFVTRPFGMILVTGPTGSGKTTTLYAVLRQLEIRKANVITIEDPVEYKLEGINQIQVDPDIGMTFASGLRTILRQDPDIILVGEIRDKETAEIAVQAALTGHLVFSTLHTNDAASTITRFMDMGIESFLISATVIGCIAQRLCRAICPECKTEYTATKEDADIIEKFAADRRAGGKTVLKKGEGCDFCFNSGFKGREAIFELLKVSDVIRRLIVAGASSDEIRDAAIKEGMRTLSHNGILKILDGVSTIEEVRRVVNIEG